MDPTLSTEETGGNMVVAHRELLTHYTFYHNDRVIRIQYKIIIT
jgi:hypothetical protein